MYFRIYDKEGNGYISTDTLKEILKELDNKVITILFTIKIKTSPNQEELKHLVCIFFSSKICCWNKKKI